MKTQAVKCVERAVQKYIIGIRIVHGIIFAVFYDIKKIRILILILIVWIQADTKVELL